jgi:hypothetical protein
MAKEILAAALYQGQGAGTLLIPKLKKLPEAA